MNTSLAPAPGTETYDARRLLGVIGLALALGYLVFLAGSVLQGHWLIDHAGQPVANDFVMTWSGGWLALHGEAPLAYDWTVAKDVAVAAAGHSFDGYFPFFYPPTYLLVAAPFALLPLIPAMLVWLAVTGGAYAGVVRLAAGDRVGWFLACAFPAAMWNVTATQNGFLTTALLGGALLALPRRPLLAGALLGLLTYKPHFGLLIPLVLAVDGRWRAILAATAVGGALAAASWTAFGSETWMAFLSAIPRAGETNFSAGLAGWAKLQSIFGLVRVLGGGQTLAWIIHGTVAAATAVAVCLLWRRRAPYALKAAALTVGAFLVTPYAYIYDCVVLALPVAFLLRLGFRSGFAVIEFAGLAAVFALLLLFLLLQVQMGLAAGLILAALIARRALCQPGPRLPAAPLRSHQGAPSAVRGSAA